MSREIYRLNQEILVELLITLDTIFYFLCSYVLAVWPPSPSIEKARQYNV